MPVGAGEVVAEELAAIAVCLCRLEFYGGGATACAALAPAQCSARPRFAAEEGQPFFALAIIVHLYSKVTRLKQAPARPLIP